LDPRSHYQREEVAREIAEFLRGRWAGVYLSTGGWLRWSGRKPLRVEEPRDVAELAGRGARTFYGTIEVFRRLEGEEDVFDLYESNVVGADSFIDIDIVVEELVEEMWPYALQAAGILAEWLSNRIGPENVYLLWSGAGVHVRIPWQALAGATHEGRSLDPVAAAYLVAEYALRSNKARLDAVTRESGWNIKIENIVGRKRLFTAPLSLHKTLDLAAVAFTPEQAPDFHLDWARPEAYKHNPQAWRRARRGAATPLVRQALKELGGLPERTLIAGPDHPAPARPARERGPRAARIGRFPVMALLQAARYYVLNRDLDKAKSFGLNRAIFYAWAKYHGPARSAARRLAEKPPTRGRAYGSQKPTTINLQRVPGMDEEAPVSENGWYVMGGVEQRPEDFDRNVARRFEEAGIPFEKAWQAAVEYVSRFPPGILRNPRLFYERVYLPVRDDFTRILRETPERLYTPSQERNNPPRQARPHHQSPKPKAYSTGSNPKTKSSEGPSRAQPGTLPPLLAQPAPHEESYPPDVQARPHRTVEPHNRLLLHMHLLLGPPPRHNQAPEHPTLQERLPT